MSTTLFKNVASQRVRVYAYTPADGLPKTGDAANITVYIAKDYGSVTAITDTSATEEDATNAPGYYWVDISQSETNADNILVTAKSSTSGVKVLGAPAIIGTRPATGFLAPATAGRTLVVDAAGLADANVVKVGPSGSGTAQTAGDLAALINAVDDYVDTEIADIRNRLPAALTADGLMKSDTLRVGGTLQTAGDLAALINAVDDYVDTEIADIRARLPAALTSDGLMKSDTLRVGGTLQTAGDLVTLLNAIDDYVDTEVAAIKAKTDNLPSDPADASDVAAALSALQAAVLLKLLKYTQLLARKDAAIATDNATELTAINASGGSGAGAFANTTDALEAIRDRGDAAWGASGAGSKELEGTCFRSGSTYYWQAALRVNGSAAASGDLSAATLVGVRGNGNADLGPVEVGAAAVGTNGTIYGSFTLTTAPALGKPFAVVVKVTYGGTEYTGHLRAARFA